MIADSIGPRTRSTIRWAVCLLGAPLVVGCAGARPDSVPVSVRTLSPHDFPIREVVRHDDLTEALRSGQLDGLPVNLEGAQPEVSGLVDALRAVLEGDLTGAEAHFEALSEGDHEVVAAIAQRAYHELLFNREDYAGLIRELSSETPEVVRLLAEGRPQSLRPGTAVARELTVGPRGHIGVTGSVGQATQTFWVDTGAALTVLTESVAASFGVRWDSARPIELDTSTSESATAYVGRVAVLTLGEVELLDHRVFVVPDSSLHFELSDGSSYSLEAILGWNAIRHLRLELDVAAGRYRAQRSEPTPSSDPNLTWLGYPLVRAMSYDGHPLLLGYDSGSWNSSITADGARRMDKTVARVDTVRVQGVGGAVPTALPVVEDFDLVLGRFALRWDEVLIEGDSGADEVEFFLVDGVLGIDVSRRCVTVIDAPRQRLDLVDCREG